MLRYPNRVLLTRTYARASVSVFLFPIVAQPLARLQ